MFYRCKFVTNSSSSSYIGWGYKLKDEELDELSDDQSDELKDMWNEGPQNITFINGDGSPSALVCIVARYYDEDFVHFLTEEQNADRLAANEALRKILNELGLTPDGPPVWVFSHSYG